LFADLKQTIAQGCSITISKNYLQLIGEGLEMKCLNYAAIMLLVSASLTLTTLNIDLAPALSESVLMARSSAIVTKISVLKKSNQRWIEIDLSSQRLTAWQGKTPDYAVIISTGKDATPTLTGVFAIQTKLRTARMQGDDYDIPDVPYTMFYSGGYAIHGAYWHRSFGTPVSHGCVNVAVDHAQRLFDWAEVGTPVIVRE
jgi:lipoprotein-anchoring transpeptidase ErfK/SrfK